ncbi:MAG: hypothetical protein MHPSP_004095, partial [Paramarteilia canceri]
ILGRLKSLSSLSSHFMSSTSEIQSVKMGCRIRKIFSDSSLGDVNDSQILERPLEDDNQYRLIEFEDTGLQATLVHGKGSKMAAIGVC